MSSAVEPKANIATVLLRPCKVTDLRSLLEIYREGFREEIAFFFRRFSRSFFKAVFRLFSEDTIVAEVSDNVVGFIIPVLGVAPMLRTGVARVVLTLPALFASVRSSFFVYVMQKLRNTKWGGGQLGIGCIGVKAEYRGRGIGGLLMHEVLTRYPTRDMVLDVRPWNRSALRLYTGAGFRETGVWRDPLGEWVVMSRRRYCSRLGKVCFTLSADAGPWPLDDVQETNSGDKATKYLITTSQSQPLDRVCSCYLERFPRLE